MSMIHRIIVMMAFSLTTSTLHAQSDIQISSRDGLLSVQANNVSASELAAELSEQLGISVVVTGNTETQVNLEIVDEPLEVALGKLSPNNMLVRDSNAEEITEVVLMMGEGPDSGSSSNADQFLPSGSPADEIIADQSNENFDQGAMREPNRAERARAAAQAAGNNGGVPAPQLPPMFADDGTPLIDPATGLPYEQ